MRIVLPALEPWQKEVYDDLHEARGNGNIYVVKSKRQVGKSCLASVLLIEYGLTAKCISVVCEPTQAQSRRLFKQISDMMGKTGLVKSANSQLLTMEFTNGSEILFKSAEQRDALRGFTVSGLLVIDEAAFTPDPIFEILYPTCDANNAPILVISTPLFCSGEFHKLYMLGKDGDARIKSYDWSRFDTSKFLPPERLEFYRSTMSSLKFKSEYLGEFIAEGSYLFGDINKNIMEKSGRAVYAGIDWGAGTDNDYTVMVMFDGEGSVVDTLAMRDITPTDQVRRLAERINSNPGLRAVALEINSIGRIYYDMLREAVRNPGILRLFTTTNTSKRSVIEQLIAAFQNERITIPDDDEMKRELQHYSVEKTKTGYTYNGADGVHDDYVIALALGYDAYVKSLGNAAISWA